MNSFLKSYKMLAFAALLLALQTQAQVPMQDSVKADRVSLKRDGSYLTVGMTLRLSEVEAEGDRAVLITPLLENGDTNKALRPIGIYSRNRYFHYARQGKGCMLGGADELSFKEKDKPDTLAYQVILPYEEWMDGASLTLFRQDYGCCGKVLAEQSQAIGEYRGKRPEFIPLMVYVQPEVERTKTRALAGTAYIDFPVSRTEIRPEYRNNQRELDKITATIDSVQADKDITVTSLAIKGYASPEGSYAGNARLAAGRTEALKEYVSGLYHFGAGFIRTSSEPEDWEGLRRYVDGSALEHRQEILAIIDSDEEPDRKERRIKSAYPADYRILLRDCYPALRHSDYRIEYTIRSFTDTEEIRRIMRTQPQKLSLQELFLVAQECEPGSKEFDEVFDIAVRLYPDDPVANLNAANTALHRKALPAARRYLAKAGDMPQAVYARGICALLEKNYPEAETLLKQAQSAGITEADTALEELQLLREEED